VQRHIEEGLAPKDAARKAMEELSGPVIGIALVLSSVFVPTAFVPGITGRLYQQFAMTIAISVIISAFNALSLSPALAGLLLRPRLAPSAGERRGLLRRFFDAFNRYFQRSTDSFVRWSGDIIRKGALVLVLLAACGLAAAFFHGRLPSSFLPDEDQGYVYVNMQLPDAASLQRTDAAAREVEKVLAKTPGVQYTTSVIGFSLLSYIQTTYDAFFFVVLKPWSTRQQRDEQFQAIKYRLNQELSSLPQGTVFSFSPPAIPGVGTSGGFTLVLEDRGGHDVPYLAANVNQFVAAARKRPEIGSISSSLLPSVPQKFIDVDRDKALKLGVPIADIYQTIQTFMGGYFVNYFNRFGREWQVYVEGAGPYRTTTQDLSQYYVRNGQGQMVPLSALAKFEARLGPEFIMHYNEYPAAQIYGSADPDYSSDQATTALEEVFQQTMPREMGLDYMGMSYQEQKARQGVSPAAIFGFSLLFVFLILAALYESWSMPFSVLLSTPVAVFGALGALWLRRVVLGAFLPPYMVQIENDVYTQIGLVMLIGLAAKNSILIVAFAKDDYDRGMPLVDAALTAARVRFRPLLMTALAFIFGCVPLWTASGAGAVARQVMGTTVIGGMVAETFIGRFFVPAIFCVVEKLSGAKRVRALAPSPPGEAPAGGEG
jgi:HAE1 family hydrophobic/amphiphilic exporter-1